MEIKGIDVSKWQGRIDWKAVAGSGVKFAMIRAAYGSTSGRITIDPYFAENVRGAVAAGIAVGVYLYSYARTVYAARLEAQNLVAALATSKEQITYPVAYDLEDASQQSLGRVRNGEMVRAFCDVVRAAGYQPILYANKSWIDNHIDVPDDVPVWLARWGVSDPGMPCQMWQYSDSGSVVGIKGSVDMNISYIDYAVPDYRQQVKARFGFEDKTLDYLAAYQFGADLLRKLATAP